jgi:hypothetical protein
MEEKEIEKIETIVRLILGQRNFGAMLGENRPEHLRFSMSGNRDGNEGEDANVEIWKKFYNFFGHKVSIRRSYNDKRPVATEYVFTFHKGCGYLKQIVIDEETGKAYFDDENEISYGGYGTVDILTDLIVRFIGEDYDVAYELIKNVPEESLLSARFKSKHGMQTIEHYC